METIRGTSEKGLIIRLKDGDKRAFELIFERYKDYLYLFICKAVPSREDSEGIVQETFISLWLNRGTLDENKPLKPYLFTIAKNEICDHLRKIYSKRKYLDSLFSEHSANPVSEENEIEYWEFERYLLSQINQLPERRKEIFRLSKLEGKSYREIACLLKISENTVDMQMRSANSAIFQAIKQYLAYLVILLLNI